ncbi:o-succinylbenzoate synthase [Anaerotardibacter muris]|uniref:o-succinylbenzoate synthase n=1 Tax=Anaerotardibacter muris TaxID=2941505 RepID=UPI00203F3C66|nr:o-succinylbenzoate synthase [Anaerotardibacter muris]
MIIKLAQLAQQKGSKAFFYTQLESGSEVFSYRQTRLAAAALARELEKHGLGTKERYIACNLYNGPEFVFLSFAVAYLGATLAVMNPRLSDEERLLRKVELENASNQPNIAILNEEQIQRLVMEGLGMGIMDLAHQPNGQIPVNPRTMEILSYAEQKEKQFDPDHIGLIMFTSGSSGTPKATQLSWRSLHGAAVAATKALCKPGKGIWQLVLPMCHIGGFEVMVRSLVNESPFLLYLRYQPARLLNDALSFKVTHISVVDKILQDLLAYDHDRIIAQYRCILLGGAALNKKTVKQALRAKATVYASYGMTETSSMIACAPITRGFDGGLRMLPGYLVHIVQPDKQGVGQLQVKGPGVFSGYLNARAAMSMDGYFVTGDRARMGKDGKLFVYERLEDLIISGGENIYPEEIREALLRIPGVKDAYVFGTADELWGYRPVAFIEADYSPETIAKDHAELGLDPAETGIRPASCPQEFARNIHEYLEPHMSHLHHPKHILVLSEFPRTSVGKVDRIALKRMYDRRIDIKSMTLYRTRQAYNEPIKTAKRELDQRESFYVEIEDWAGRTGIGECVSFTTNWYLPETLGDDYAVTKDIISSVVMNERYLHPSEVSRSLATFPALAYYPMAKAAVESATWDLYGKVVAAPLWELIGGVRGKQVLGGTTVGIMSTEETLAEVDRAVAAGYQRVKIKINPDSCLEKVRAVREKYPDLMLFLDANQSFTEENMDILAKLDPLNITCLEEPLDPSYKPSVGTDDLLERLSLLQESLQTPICLDESVVSAREMHHAMEIDNLKVYAIKIAKFGGVQPALDFCRWAAENGKQIWMAGMFDTGVSKRTYAAFETLPFVDLPGDVSDATCYFREDVAIPPLMLKNGVLTLNNPGHEAGIGCVLNKEYLKKITIEEIRITK